MKLRYLLLPLLCLLSPAVFADSMFDIPLQDQSMMFLSMIFGSVGDVLPGGDSSLLKGVMIDFNYAVLVLGGIIIIYSLMVSTVNTAHQGEALGKEWNSVWIPMRAAMGFALLLPVNPPNDYALIQVIAMWVVREGVGAADYLWSNGVDAIQSGTATVNLASTGGGTMGLGGSAGVYDKASNIFVSQVCARQGAYYLLNNVQYSSDNNKEKFGIQGQSPSDICGSVSYDTGSDNETQATNDATTVLWQATDDVAEDFLNYYNQNPQLTDSQINNIQRSLQAASINYTSAISQASSQAASQGHLGGHVGGTSRYSDAVAKAKDSGWIYAGAYYITLSNALDSGITKKVSGPSTSGADQKKMNKIMGNNAANFSATLSAAKAVSTPEDLQINSPDDISAFFQGHLFSKIEQGIAGLIMQIYQAVLTGGGVDPVMAIATFGRWMAALSLAVYAAFVGAMVALTVAAYGISNEIFASTFGAGGVGPALTSLITFIVAPLQVALGILLVQGMVMGYYVPLIPFFVFSMGAISWMILVIEAMIAAPIMALGILHPEGQHTVWGRGEAGLMLLTSLFLRPSLMIVGFFASIVMVYVVVFFINIGFMPVFVQDIGSTGQVLGGAVSVLMSPIALIMLLSLYTIFMLIGINKAFSLIHHVPDRIMRWIGHQGDISTSAEQELAQMKGGAEAGGGKAQEAAGGGMEGGAMGLREGRKEVAERNKASGPKGGGDVTGTK